MNDKSPIHMIHTVVGPLKAHDVAPPAVANGVYAPEVYEKAGEKGETMSFIPKNSYKNK